MTSTRWRRRPFVALVAVLVAAVVGGVLAFSSGSLPGNNLHAVVPGQIYRSAQPSPDDLRELVEQHGIVSVVAVRPPQAKKDWFRAEQQAVEALGLSHASLELHPNDMPSRDQMRRLVRELDEASRPVLLHCRAGVERTGLAATVALLLEGVAPERAREQFGLRYGFVPGLGTTDLPEVIDRYERWLDNEGTPHTPERFRLFVEVAYVADFYAAEIELTSRPADPRAGETIPLLIRVRNASPESIVFTARERGVHVGMRLRSIDQEPAWTWVGRSGFVDHSLDPGASIDLPVDLAPVPRAGRYRVVLDLVDEGVEWFGDMGSPVLEAELVVGPARGSRARADG